ncbi:hypothetical protein CDEST_03502 [Colletotrichum destructivum]|uniref:Uncharacterized protein n=1 Tax=Colletotrichum destructivum TaxID=34406 RepID=A0AAX4I668_9PEZI|nr:hypothetical protein CDEST_03502 [Colletotrichum destructivum]
MPPYETPHAVQAPRYTEGEASTGNCSEVLGLVVTVTALSVLCVLALLTATIQWRRFLTARKSQQEIANSLNRVLQTFSKLREKHEAQSKEVFRLQKVVKRFMPCAQSSWFPQPSTERNATGTAHVSEATKHKREDELTPCAPLPQHEEVFVVGCDEEEEEEEEEEEAAEQNTEHDARACDSRPDSSTFEKDPSAPRLATTVVVHTGARLPSEEPASAKF